jgi:hypothetical protein
LYDRLTDRFSEGQVFIDVDTIEPGVDFAEAIFRAVAACTVLLAIIGPAWLTATNQRGRRRLDDPDDIVRLEIEAALARDVRVIPILVEGAVMPRREDLPKSLAGLARRNALFVRHESFRYDAGRLITAIERILAPASDVAADPGASGSYDAEIEQVDKRPTRDESGNVKVAASVAGDDLVTRWQPVDHRGLIRPQEADPSESWRGQRKYPWDKWTDGSTWQIWRGQDYDVATENMRVNLHTRASSMGRKVRTRKLKDDDRGEGLAFQFLDSEPSKATPGCSDDPDAIIELLYQDAVEIYERARREVTIPRKDGRYQKYAANRYKQQIDKAHAEHRLVAAIGQIVSRPTQGFGHLENAGRDDLMVETLVLDASKPYHQLFPAATVEMARERMAQYRARHPKPST